MMYFDLDTESLLNKRQLNHIDALFSTGNDIVDLYYEIQERRKTLFMMSLSRFLVSELDTFRHGLRKISRKKFDFIEEKEYFVSDALLRDFDNAFGQVRDHRNVLQHFGEYLFGDQDPAKVDPKEFSRIGAPITVAP